jgi:hypothetical protein
VLDAYQCQRIPHEFIDTWFVVDSANDRYYRRRNAYEGDAHLFVCSLTRLMPNIYRHRCFQACTSQFIIWFGLFWLTLDVDRCWCVREITIRHRKTLLPTTILKPPFGKITKCLLFFPSLKRKTWYILGFIDFLDSNKKRKRRINLIERQICNLCKRKGRKSKQLKGKVVSKNWKF